MKPRRIEESQNPKRREFIENLDYYFENGLMVLTAHFLRERGYCCGNGCRHCPYQTIEAKEKENLPISPNSQ
ncbi:MAG TPA: DUF5522 domain-containing protein [Pyrinomonadaceae bacterium]